MQIESNIIVFLATVIPLLSIMLLLILRKRKRSAKNIYKLIDDLEKKYIY